MMRNSPISSTKGTASEPLPKSMRLMRSDHEWDKCKDDIRNLYMIQDESLDTTMEAISSKYAFKRRFVLTSPATSHCFLICTLSLRAWKAKMKEWGFIKHFPAEDMAFVASKYDERKAHPITPKDTVFVRGGIIVQQNRIANFKKLNKSELTSSRLPVDAGMLCGSSSWFETDNGWESCPTKYQILHTRTKSPRQRFDHGG